MLLTFDTSERHRDAGDDFISSAGQDLANLDRVDICKVLSLIVGHVAFRSGLVEKVTLLDDFVALGGLSRFTFRRLVQLLVELRLDALLVLPVLEGVEVAVDELVELRQVSDITEVLIDGPNHGSFGGRGLLFRRHLPLIVIMISFFESFFRIIKI